MITTEIVTGPQHPHWQEPLTSAILEFDLSRLAGKIQILEEAIASRVKELSFERDNEHELRAFHAGLSIVRSLKRNRLGVIDA